MNNASYSQLPFDLEDTIRDNNPWWRGDPLVNLPEMRRWAFEPVKTALKEGLAPAVVLRGPCQVGKTTLLNQIIQSLLDEGVSPNHIFRVQFDELPALKSVKQPILDLPRWFAEKILRSSFAQTAAKKEPAYIFFDEVQNLVKWSEQLKHFVDMQPVRVMATGSSALRIEAGRDSLAGRITTFDMGPLLLREIASLRGFGSLPPFAPTNGLGPLKQKQFWRDLRAFGEKHHAVRMEAFRAFSERGAYPVAHDRPDQPWENVADFLVETVINRALQHDLRMGPKGQKRDEALLEEVFRLACRYAGQAPSQALYTGEIRQALHANIGPQRILTYLKFLDGTLLLRLVEPLEIRLKRRRTGRKICLCDHALRAAWLQEVVPLAPEQLDSATHLQDLAGHIAESTAGYFLCAVKNLDVAHFPERGHEQEVDFVLTIGDQRIPVEIKYQSRISFAETVGLRAFIEKAHYNAPFGLLITKNEEGASDDPRIVSMPLSTLLILK